jgi:CDGSH-type Zn-finger protein
MSETLSSELTRLLNETLNQAAEAPSETRDSWESHRAALIYEAARVFRRCLNDIGHQGQVEDVPAGETEPGESADERLWDLTKLATAVGAREDVRGALDQAVAALQVASCVFASPGADISTRIDELRSVQRGLQQQVRVHANGPYIVTNVDTLTTWLGESYPNTPRMSLCRCGGSASKPFCDGTHARKPFDDGKDPKRLPDRQNTYVGQQVTILDNRGTCAHSGFCTDRLSSVFHLKEDPFITPSGARMDEIVRAVRDCPSGALSLAIDGREARDTVDTVRKRSIEVSRDGPYRVTGGIPLVDDKGVSVTRNAGASLEHYSLCRCGHSQNKPFCSGMHWYVRFQDPVSSPDHQPTLFEWVGGLPALTRMTRLFYSKLVPEDPLIVHCSPRCHPTILNESLLG